MRGLWWFLVFGFLVFGLEFRVQGSGLISRLVAYPSPYARVARDCEGLPEVVLQNLEEYK